jgi:hypothetical protein
MTLPNGWTGRTACALQSALRLSNEAFAERLGVAVRTVAAWHQKPTLRPKPEIQQLLDTALAQAAQDAQARFTQTIRETDSSTTTQVTRDPDAERRLVADPAISAILEWLDTDAGWEPGTSRRKVSARLDVLDLHDRGARRARVDQHQIVRALRDYYADIIDGYGNYGARYGGDRTAITSILTCARWLDLECDLIPENDRLEVIRGVPDPSTALDPLIADHAVQRLAEMLALGFRLINTPLYRLLRVDIGRGLLAGDLDLIPFVRYALTMDLLEGELVDAVAAGRPSVLPLRDRLLPDVVSVLDLSSRLCSGGALALCAIARPATSRTPADYVLLIQERSGRVLNAARRLAVIPKGFHEPLVDYRADAQIAATLRREMEEELFGRADVDNTEVEQLTTDPMHPSRLSDPMRWLTEQPSRLHLECTGFGLNLVSGNCEFASLIVINDDEFWPRFGGQITANWESGALRQYSSLDKPPDHRSDQRHSLEQRRTVRAPPGPEKACRTRRSPGRPAHDRMGDQLVAPTWYSGNATDDAPQNRGWLLGHFMNPTDGVRSTNDVEVKWGIHPSGDQRATWTADDQRTTLVLLVQGRFRVELTEGTVTMQRQGDYIMWGPGIDHTWHAEEDSIVITVRWPSRPV